jgi:hypothetical protein
MNKKVTIRKFSYLGKPEKPVVCFDYNNHGAITCFYYYELKNNKEVLQTFLDEVNRLIEMGAELEFENLDLKEFDIVAF